MLYLYLCRHNGIFVMQEKELIDEVLGRMQIKVNPRARHIILRTHSEGIRITVPPGVGKKEILSVVEKFRERLEHDKEKSKKKRIDLDYKIETEYFRLSLTTGTLQKFISHSELGLLQIICPKTANFDDDNLQEWLHKVIEEALRRNAKVVLPTRLQVLSDNNNLPYEQVRINSSKGRWGSCSTRKHINLSYYLLLLPSHLMDYVLLHELCHTKEMNHGERFWALLNRFTNGRSLALRDELKKYKTEI